MIHIVPWPARFIVPPQKITHYLLDPASDDGKSKCAYLSSYGFLRRDPAKLAQALIAQTTIEAFIGVIAGPWGLKYRFDGPIRAPNGRDAHLLTVWQVRAESDGTALFVTSRPSRR